MIELRYVLFIEDTEFGSRLHKIISDFAVKVYLPGSLNELIALSRERMFDFLLWVTQDPHKQLAEVENLLKERPYLFACLFCKNSPDQSVFDFVFNFDDFNDSAKLRSLLKNMHRLALRIKTQKEQSLLVLHDLRTPLQNLASYIDMLISGTFGPLNDGQIKILQTISAQTDVADELVQELALILRMRKKEFFIEKHPIDLSRLISDTLRSVWIWADRKNIKLQAHVEHELPKVNADALAIRRVLFNLLLNALKFSPNDSSVRLMVTLEPSSAKGQKIECRITDSGPGIPPEHLTDIFDPYFRLNNPKSLFKGQGLGLHIAKLFVEAHGGTIGAHNNREGGATFYFTLPVVSGKS